ncbi:MAG: hypothetical protein HQK65_11440 [Desulfamplus sp.]|nr:hypothetical protein [Desulfamplus sp.]
MREDQNHIDAALTSTVVVKTKLDEITHCQLVMDNILKKKNKNTCCFNNYNIFKQSFQIIQNQNLLQLIKESANALKLNNTTHALFLLNLLATYDPLNILFNSFSDYNLVESQSTNDSDTIKYFIHKKIQDKQWLTSTGNDDFRTVLGIQQFIEGDYDTAITIFMSISWELASVHTLRFFLGKSSILYWGGGAFIVESFIRTLEKLSSNPFASDIENTIQYGIFSAYTKQYDNAKQLLLPLLPSATSNPERLFQIIDALWQADCGEELKSFFCKPGILTALEKILDSAQLIKLYAFLFNIGVIAAPTKGFRIMAENPTNFSAASYLPSLVYGLTNTRALNQADQLINRSLILIKGQKKIINSCDTMLFAESLILTGKIDQGRYLLNTIKTKRKFGDSLSPKLFLMHEVVSQFDKIKSLLPSIIDFSQDIKPQHLGYIFLTHFYEKKYELGLKLMIESNKPGGVIPAHIGFLFWLGKFEEARSQLETNAFKGNGPIGQNYLIWSTYLHLANNKFEIAIKDYKNFLKLLDKNVVNIDNIINNLVFHFEYILLLRFGGYQEQAFNVAQYYSKRYQVFNNPCHALLLILCRETKNSEPSVEEAQECERIADVLLNPRLFCQGWLYLHAAVLQSKLGNYNEAKRILRDKLSNTMFLDPEKRKLLINASGKDIATLRNQIQSMFFPYFHDTYWNCLIDSVIFDK